MADKNNVIVRSRYTPRGRVITKLQAGTRTKRSFAAECDINNIMKKYERTGVLPELKARGVYGDFSEAVDYQEACNLVLHAETQFNGLPARVRERFANDPVKFLEFVQDGRNAQAMAEMGLMDPKAMERVSRAKESKFEGSGDEPSPRKSSRKGGSASDSATGDQ